jgi:hypothetical protein
MAAHGKGAMVMARIDDAKPETLDGAIGAGRAFGGPNAEPEAEREPEPEPEPQTELLELESPAWTAITVAEWTQLQQLAEHKYVCPCHEVLFSGPAATGITWDWVVAPTAEDSSNSGEMFGAVRSVACDSLAATLGVSVGMVLIMACDVSQPHATAATHKRAVDMCELGSARPLRCLFRLLSTSTSARVAFALGVLAEARELFDLAAKPKPS